MKIQKKIMKEIIHLFNVDDFRYGPWRWDWRFWNTWSSDFKNDYYPQIRPLLLKWQEKGYITIIEDDEIVFITHPEKFPAEQVMIEELKSM
jgi:hypothetical protein